MDNTTETRDMNAETVNALVQRFGQDDTRRRLTQMIGERAATVQMAIWELKYIVQG